MLLGGDSQGPGATVPVSLTAGSGCCHARVPHARLWWWISQEVVSRLQTRLVTVLRLQPCAGPSLRQVLDVCGALQQPCG